MNKLKYIAAIAITCASLGLVSQASATIIDLGQTQSNPADLPHILGRLQGQIDLYNGTHNPDLPDALLAGAQKTDIGGLSINIDVTGWTYIELAWDGKDQFYYVGGETGLHTFNSTVFNRNAQPQALSHYALFNPNSVPTPDGGATIMLLGAALGSLGMVRRFLKK
jgi:hypothetical protein